MITIKTDNLNEVVALFTLLFEIEDVYRMAKLETTQSTPMFSVVVNDDKRWKQSERWLLNHGIQVTSQGIKLCGQQILEFQTDNWIDVNLGLEMLSYIESTPESNSVREMLMECEYALPPVKV